MTHANWVRHQVSEDAPAIDVSLKNDWTRVRVWWPPADQLGATAYATFGFIQAERPPGRDRIGASAREITRIAIRD